MDIIFTKCSNNRQNKIVQRILKPDNLKENTDYTSILGNNSNYLPLKEYYRESISNPPLMFLLTKGDIDELFDIFLCVFQGEPQIGITKTSF